jgi:membrane fusion protein, multidrug efflux system
MCAYEALILMRRKEIRKVRRSFFLCRQHRLQIAMNDRIVAEHPQIRPDTLPNDESDVGGEQEKRRSSEHKKRKPWGTIAMLLLIGVIGASLVMYRRQPAAPQGPNSAAMPVTAVAAIRGDLDVTIDVLGTVTSLATITVVTQISGEIMRAPYTEGQDVKKGDLLFEIDSRPYEIALAQAQGALERDEALLRNAELDLKRYQDLAKSNAIPHQQLDTQESLVLQDRGNVISDQAQIEAQQLNIAYCHIVAPVDGRVGLRLVDPGNYVTPSLTTGLTVVTQIRPITVIFPVAEDYVPQIRKRIRAGASLPTTAFDRSGRIQLSEGELRSLDSQINTTTGTLNMRAQFANQDEALFPNQFVNIRLLIDKLHDTVIVPTSAIQRGAPGTFVYLVRSDRTVTIQPVTVGPSDGDRVAVQSGLSPGDQVVTDGADRLRNGAKVFLIQSNGDAVAPANNADVQKRKNGRSR